MEKRTKTFLIIALLSVMLLGCTPRPPSWPPFPEKLADTSSWYVDMARFQRSVHGTLACAECHADIKVDNPSAPHPELNRLVQEATALYKYETCQTCHPQEYTAYEQGVHAEAMTHPERIELAATAPTCGHCHSAHYAMKLTRAELLAKVNETCGECHPEALKTYEHNYHGKVALLGREETATCTDCHGAHTVLALYEADESLPACRRCHPKANESFVGYRIHAQATLTPEPDPRAAEFRIFFWVTLFFTCLVVGVLAFFYTHTGLWFLRSLHERLRKRHHE
ncbi:MAG: hypothetical protein ACUVWZ_13565 [Anaerolineae bacterium]